MNAWATTIISGLVFVVAFMQWRTAHQKVVLELFDRRLAVMNEVNDAISYAVTENGNLVSINAAMRLYDCEAKGIFLFGSEVITTIGRIREGILSLHRLRYELEHGEVSVAEANKLNDQCGEAFKDISNLQQILLKQVLPFMRLHTKVVSTPAEWFQDRNRLRMSYADEKQR